MLLRFEPLECPFKGMKIWGAEFKDYFFVIVHDDGTQLTPEEYEGGTGYTVSYRFRGSHIPTLVDGLWKTFEEAESVCRATLLQLVTKTA